MSSGIVKVIVSFYRKSDEVAFERHRSKVPVDLGFSNTVLNLKRHLKEFLGLTELASKYGLGSFNLKLYDCQIYRGGRPRTMRQ